MKIPILFVALFALVSCNPCRYVAKHQECFHADTVIKIKDVVHYQKEYITNDSIVFQEIPCDPVDSIIYKTKTVYKTNYKTIIDTIYQSKEVAKINPINEQLKNQNDKLLNKVKLRNIIIGILLIFVLVVFAFRRF